MSPRRGDAAACAVAASMVALVVAWRPAAVAAEDDQAVVAEAEYGIGLRVRGVFAPKGLIELFVEEASSGMFHPGFGLDFVRRRGNFELVVGIEHESVSPEDGYWLEKGDDGVSEGEYPDYVDIDGLAWTTLDFALVFHAALAEKLALRYGAGLGLGLVHGDALKTDQRCSSRNFEEDCMQHPLAVEVRESADLPPVFPVVNLVLGLQYRPHDQVTINLETGLRTAPFFGLSGAYFF